MEEPNDKEIQKQQDITLLQMKQTITKTIDRLKVMTWDLFLSKKEEMDISSRIHSLEKEIAELTAVLTGLMITCRQTSRRRGRGLK